MVRMSEVVMEKGPDVSRGYERTVRFDGASGAYIVKHLLAAALKPRIRV
jgi:hypothetical protein